MIRRTSLSILAAIGLLFLVGDARAQVFAIHFKTEKIAKKYRKNLTYIGGDYVLVGEPRSGIKRDLQANKITYSPGRNELFVSDPSDPTRVPYRIEEGEYEPVGRKAVVAVPGDHIERVRIHLDNQSLLGLAREYELRLASIAEIEAELKELPSGDSAWFRVHRRLVMANEKLRTWLAGTAFPVAAEKLDKKLKKMIKVGAKDAAADRARRARESVRTVEPSEELVEAAKTITGGKLTFHVQESQHVRMVYDTETLSDGVVTELLELAERLIDSFRIDLIDPFLSETYTDRLPDGLFQEYWFGPDEIPIQRGFYNDYYKLKHDFKPKDGQAQPPRGLIGNLGSPARALSSWRMQEAVDVEGLVAHTLGHTIAEIHYGGRIGSEAQDWLEEAVGYYLSLEFLGRNNVVCFGSHTPKKGGYQKKEEDKKERGEKPIQLGLRDFYNKVALDAGPKIDKLAMKIRYELDEADLSKSWSFYDYLVRKEGVQGQLWLRAACKHAPRKRTFIEKWRADAEAIYEIEGQNIFALIDDRWREFALTEQDKGEGGRERGDR